MATGGFDAVTNALKTVYVSKTIVPMVNEEAPFRRYLKGKVPASARVSEGILKFGANFDPPQNQGQMADGDNLPVPKDRTQDQFTLNPTLFAGTFQIGWVTRRAGNTSKSAFNGGELRRKTEETIADIGKYIEQTFTSTHGTGRRGRVLTDGVNTITMDKPETVRLFRNNQYISVRTTDGGNTVRDSLDYRLITDIDLDTNTITYDGADQTAVAGDHVHVVTKASQTSLSTISSNGLRGLVDDGTYASSLHALSRSTYSKLNSIVKDNGGSLRDLSEQLLVNASHEVRQRSQKRVTDIWTNTGQIEKYIEFVAPDRRYTQSGRGITQMATGYQEDSIVHYAPGVSMKFNISVDILPREIFLLNWDCFFHYKAQELDWWDDGSGLLKPLPTDGGFKAAWFAALSCIENIGCDYPIGNAVIRDLKDPLLGD